MVRVRCGLYTIQKLTSVYLRSIQLTSNMNKREITKNIKDKIGAWTSHIGNKQLRDEVRKNVIVSGGCISSMLLDEPVHDYDVYLSDVRTAFKLARYYADLTGNQHHSLELVDNGVRFAAPIAPSIIGKTKEKFSVVTNENMFQPINFSINAITLSSGIQVVIRFCGSVEEIHKTFDFVHSKNYYTPDNLVLNADSLEAILAKELRYVGSGFPLCALFRVNKFLKRGWKISPNELLKISYDIGRINFDDPEFLEEQLSGPYGQAIAYAVETNEGKLTREKFFEFVDTYNPIHPDLYEQLD